MNTGQEYLITNGMGGFASGMSMGGSTRKYHGVLVAAHTDLIRMNVVNRLDEWFEDGTQKIWLSTNHYNDGVITPHGFQNLADFSLDHYPRWTFEHDGIKAVKSLVMVRGENTTVVKYQFTALRAMRFNLIPLLTYRNMHTLGGPDEFEVFEDEVGILVRLAESDFLRIVSDLPTFVSEQDRYSNFFYPIEKERGYDAHEDLFKPGRLQVEVPEGDSELSVTFRFFRGQGRGSRTVDDPFIQYNNRLQLLSDSFHEQGGIQRSKLSELLARQSDHFIVDVGDKKSVIAGYHWFDDWGRDTFVSFPGLFLSTNRLEEARQLLTRWKGLLRNGFLPNRPFVDDYNSLDAVFWFVNALWKYFLATKDIEFVGSFIEELEGIMLAFSEGSLGVYVDEQGYLVNTNSNKALTWMDAQINGVPVTSRSGRAVEIQALWYNYLKILLELKLKSNDRTHLTQIRSITAKLEKWFKNDFWNERAQCLYDRIDGDDKDGSVRPNQIVAVYLDFSLLGKRKSRRILDTVKSKLLTDVGLKTLASDDPAYKGNYSGSQEKRDNAYHQGTIWPFLLGHYLSARYKLELNNEKAREAVVERLNALELKLEEDNVKYLAEIYDPATMKPAGCISQAWSVATLLETLSLINK
ncbi:MAG: amylo-alpha-1,6-glucosidase [Candidatus Dojkabacteria bacterium]